MPKCASCALRRIDLSKTYSKFEYSFYNKIDTPLFSLTHILSLSERGGTAFDGWGPRKQGVPKLFRFPITTLVYAELVEAWTGHGLLKAKDERSIQLLIFAEVLWSVAFLTH
jgi:hypothetical protein